MAFAPLINGRRFSYSSIEIVTSTILNPLGTLIDCDAVDYEDALDIQFRRGTSRVPIGWTSGTYEASDSTLQLGKSACAALLSSIGPGYMGINLNVLVSYSDIGEPLVVDTLIARIAGIKDGHAYSADALTSVVKLKTFYILRNGIPPTLNRVF